MNIGIVTTWFERGAAQVSHQYKEILGQDNEVFIYARGGEKYARNNPKWDTPDVTWGKKTVFQLNGTPIHKKDFKKWIKDNNIEILFFNEQQWWLPVIWAKEWGIKTGSYIDYYTKETVPFFEIFDFLICNTERHYSAFNWHQSCHLVNWGTDINLFAPKSNFLKNDKLTFFNSAGHNPDRKGVGELINAFYKLNTNKAKLVIHSQIDLIKYYPSLNDIINELIQNNKLEIITKTVAAPGLYYLGDIYCYISKLDGIGLTVPEALASGLPVITPDHPPMNEFVKDGLNGKLVDIESTYYREDNYYWPQLKIKQKSLVDALKYYIKNSNSIESYKKNAREYAENHLDWKDRAKEINNIFKNAKKNKSSQILKKIKLYELNNIFKNIYRFPVILMKTIRR